MHATRRSPLAHVVVRREGRAMVAGRTVIAVLAAVLVAAIPAQGLTTNTAARCGQAHYSATGRVFPEPEASPTYLRYGDDFVPCMELLADIAPERVELSTYGTSSEGRDLYLVEVTDRKGGLPRAQRRTLFVDVSMHANERVPVEGAVRFI